VTDLQMTDFPAFEHPLAQNPVAPVVVILAAAAIWQA
jgi:hypothetical protein